MLKSHKSRYDSAFRVCYQVCGPARCGGRGEGAGREESGAGRMGSGGGPGRGSCTRTKRRETDSERKFAREEKATPETNRLSDSGGERASASAKQRAREKRLDISQRKRKRGPLSTHSSCGRSSGLWSCTAWRPRRLRTRSAGTSSCAPTPPASWAPWRGVACTCKRARCCTTTVSRFVCSAAAAVWRRPLLGRDAAF